jgi:hypothetical protein
MPLVIPGLSDVASSSNDAKSEWQQKLVGKKLSDSSTDSNVCPAQRSFSLVFPFPYLRGTDQSGHKKSFAKSDLPKHHRVVEQGSFMTMDHNPNRYAVCVESSHHLRDCFSSSC